MEDLTGQKFNRLTVLYRDLEKYEKKISEGKTPTNVYWVCQCDCGNITTVNGYSLKSGSTKSCGCLASEVTAERNRRDSTKINHHENIKIKNNITDIDDSIVRMYTEDMKNSFIIDAIDYEVVSKWYWRPAETKNEKKKYWVTNAKKDAIDNGEPWSLRLHQVIAEQKYGKYDKSKYMPDHLSRDINDNTRKNIYLKTNLENSHNRGLSKKNKSGKTGVFQRKDNKKWVAYIMVNYKSIYLGEFVDFDDAVAARKAAEIKYGFTCDDVKPEYDVS